MESTLASDIDPKMLEHDLRDARARTLALVADLRDDQLLGPRLAIINPFLWEIGHVGWFQENWVLRHRFGLDALRADADNLYDSGAVPHDTRWDLPLPGRAETLRYLSNGLERAVERLYAKPLDAGTAYFYRLATFHEDMHGEAFTYTRQTLGMPALRLVVAGVREAPAAPSAAGGHFAAVHGGTFRLGASDSLSAQRPVSRDGGFVFDNERLMHTVHVAPFAIGRTATTNAEFQRFVDDGGYLRRELWDDQGWAWRSSVDARHPVYWRRTAGGWEQRHFDRWRVLPPDLAVIHVNWHEASAYCRWAGCRLPTEIEWEAAATGALTGTKQTFPWGDAPCSTRLANLDGVRGDVAPADAYATGQSGDGCLQLIGNVWEWTSTPFGPYPGFVPEPYKAYSQPWFDGRHMVLRGGCWATRSRLLRGTWRNFYTRDRRDVFAGFRVCALS
jgi:iron(II)-dependent oxidoreductase